LGGIEGFEGAEESTYIQIPRLQSVFIQLLPRLAFKREMKKQLPWVHRCHFGAQFLCRPICVTFVFDRVDASEFHFLDLVQDDGARWLKPGVAPLAKWTRAVFQILYAA